jgi:hypothetical protein
MKEKLTDWLVAALRWLAGAAVKCTKRSPSLCAPLQPNGWQVKTFAINNRFTPDADLDPELGTPIGDEGYYLYILNEAANWDYSGHRILLLSIWQRPWGHSWLMLEKPGERLEFGHSGDLGDLQPRFHDGVFQRIRDGHENPIAYLWGTRSDGFFQIGKPNRPPNFVWKVPVTREKYQRMHDYVMGRNYERFGVVSHNCTDLVVATAALAGINLIHRIRLIMPSETDIWFRMRRVWTDPQYSVLDYSTPDVLEADLRQLTRLGIGEDVTKWYLALKH